MGSQEGQCNVDNHEQPTVKTLLRDRPIGVFDSGVGGLTVAGALRRRLPGENLLYLGDLARLPYGTKSPETVVRYALKAAAFLVAADIKMLVVACNTASAHALGALAQAYPGLPVLGVVEAGAAEAAKASESGRIVVAATEGTCRSEAFSRAIAARRPESRVTQLACPMFVPLVEEGLVDGPIAEAMVAHYLGAAFQGPDAADCLVLGCTHYPLLVPALRAVLGPAPALVDCAAAVAGQAAETLAEAGLARTTGGGGMRLFATDAPDRFARVAGRFLPALGPQPAVAQVDL